MTDAAEELQPLPDLLKPGLQIVFVGINPGVLSAQLGRYFAHPNNRFWPAANAAGVFEPPPGPETGHEALDQGIGFTDIVKRPTANASQIRVREFRDGAPALKSKLLDAAPWLVCFNGMTAYRNFLRHAEGVTEQPELGLQPRRIGDAEAFVVPSPSPANARYSLEDLTCYYQRLRERREEMARGRVR
ncbi:MAG: mismatch-specific DNA-glycosylase [Chloroflexota bacterium]